MVSCFLQILKFLQTLQDYSRKFQSSFFLCKCIKMNKLILCLICLVCFADFSFCYNAGKFPFPQHHQDFLAPPSSETFDLTDSSASPICSSTTPIHFPDSPQSSEAADRGCSLLSSIPWLFHTLDKEPSVTESYIARRANSELFVSGNGIKIGSRGTTLLAMTFRDSSEPYPGQLLPRKRYGDAVTNYLLGNQPSEWRVGLALWEEVLAVDIYPLIDVLYYSDPAGQLEFDFQLKAGAEPELIRFSFTGQSSITIDPDGHIMVHVADGLSFTLPPPSIYQEIEGSRVRISGGFKLIEDDVFGFWLGEYDASLPLVIDPILIFSTYFGGGGASDEYGNSVVIDSRGNIIITGFTDALNFPVMNAFDPTFNGVGDAFMAKFTAVGSLIFSTYYGGTGFDAGHAVAVDRSDNIAIVGHTNSPDLPLINAFDVTQNGTSSIFIAKFNSTGSLIFSTFFGGSNYDEGDGITFDSSDNIVIVGITYSSDIPMQNSYSSLYSGSRDAIVAKFSPEGSLIFSTYFGGSSYDEGTDIEVDSSDNIVIVGFTSSTDLPTLNAYSSTLIDGFDVYVAKFSSLGSLIFSTYFGGSGADQGYSIAVDSSDNIGITGYTSSDDLPASSATSSPSYVKDDVIVAKFSPTGSLMFSMRFGGSDFDHGQKIVFDNSDNLVITGETISADFFILNAFDSVAHGGYDVFITKFSPTGSLIFSTRFGGLSGDSGFGVAVDSSANIVVTGSTSSFDLLTLNAYDSLYNGGKDAFILKLNATGFLVFSTYFGGIGPADDKGTSVAVDSLKNITITGSTLSSVFPTLNANDSSYNGNTDAFAVMFDSAGALVFSTYFGGSLTDHGSGIAFDGSRNIVITGTTFSPNLPMFNAYSSTYHGLGDVFVAKFDSTGALLFSTYFGGSNSDTGSGIAVDGSGNIAITGYSWSGDLPKLNAYQPTYNGGYDVLIAKFGPTGILLLSTYFGGSGDDYGSDIAVDSRDNLCIIGYTSSSNLPRLNAYDSVFRGAYDLIIVKFSPAGSLKFSTYFGGSGSDYGSGIAIDNSDNLAIVGYTYSNDIPLMAAYSATNIGESDIIVAKFSASGSLIFSTFFGGSKHDFGLSIAADNRDNIAIIGYTWSSDIPVLNAFSSTNSGEADVIVAKFSPTGSLMFSTYFGGTEFDQGIGIVADWSNTLVLVGQTSSGDFPTTNAFNSEYRGGTNAFIFSFSFCSAFNGCSLHGFCSMQEICICDPGWNVHPDCSIADCSSLNNCSSHGTCVAPSTCACDPGWDSDANCSMFECHSLNDCSSHGLCVSPNTCQCDVNFDSFPDCHPLSASSNNSDNFNQLAFTVLGLFLLAVLVLGAIGFIVWHFYFKSRETSPAFSTLEDLDNA